MDGVACINLCRPDPLLINGVSRYVAVLSAMLMSFADLVSGFLCTSL
jgi:hypothetical protein